MEKKYEVTYKGGRKEVLEETLLPKFSSSFNRMVKELRIGEEMYEMDSMTNIKRIE